MDHWGYSLQFTAFQPRADHRILHVCGSTTSQPSCERTETVLLAISDKGSWLSSQKYPRRAVNFPAAGVISGRELRAGRRGNLPGRGESGRQRPQAWPILASPRLWLQRTNPAASLSRAGRVQISLKIVARIREGCSLASIERAARMIYGRARQRGIPWCRPGRVYTWRSVPLLPGRALVRRWKHVGRKDFGPGCSGFVPHFFEDRTDRPALSAARHTK